MNNNDDTGLIQAVEKGDHGAFATLVRQYEKPIYNVVYRMLHDREEARDVTQTVFLKTFENLHKYDPERKFFSWLCRIAINEAIDSQGRTRPSTEYEEQHSPEQASPGDDLQRQELHDGLEGALMTLNTDYRSVLVLKHIVGMNYHDISLALEVSEKTVKSRLFSARQKLAGKMKKEAYL
ncbi:MAG: sigma-70 family RNA polymerase sigma factor [Halieaceae bacterium]